MNNTDHKSKYLMIIAIGFILSGIVILFLFLYFLSLEYSIWGKNKIQLDKTSQVGDFIGGLVGSLWSFAGVILFYLTLVLQRKEFAAQRQVLELQREELASQRNEFTINRLTNIIYKQNDLVNRELDFIKLYLEKENYTFKGLNAINEFLEIIKIEDFKNIKTLNKDKKELLNDLKKFSLSEELSNFEHLFANSLNIVESLFMESKDLNYNKLKSLTISVLNIDYLYLFFNTQKKFIRNLINDIKDEGLTSSRVLKKWRNKVDTLESLIDKINKINDA